MHFPQSPEIPHPICRQILDIQQVATVSSCPFDDSVSVRLNSAFLHDAIALAEHDDTGLPVLDLTFGDVGEAHDGKDVIAFPWKAAAPLRTIWPEPGSPGMA